MSAFKSDFLSILEQRGFIHQISDAEGLDRQFLKGPVTAYIGYDATARSLHVGHLTQIMMLYWLQQTGHRPISLMGGGTTMIGDPSFKDEARPLLSRETIADHVAGIRRVFERYLTYGEGPHAALMIDNAEWLLHLNYVAFLREVGRHFSVNRMLSFDSVKLRLDREQPLSFLEFNYMILQAYDFVELYRREGCILQMGGSDQWGNLINGIELGHKLGTAQLYALTTPLLTTASGAKMGKTANGAVWLDKDFLSPYAFWQYWRNAEDTDVERFLKLYTILPMDEIVRLSRLQGAEINIAKKILATEVTAMLHGRAAAEEAQRTAEATFEEGMLTLALPSFEVDKARLGAGIGILTAFVEAGLASSNSEVRQLLGGGGIRVNDQVIDDPRRLIGEGDLSVEGVVKLSLGRKKHILLKPV